MKIDVSEVKAYKGCQRQWQLSSRNRFHLRPRVAPPQLAFGTIFHEALAQMYLDVPFDKVLAMVKREMQMDKDLALIAMVRGYFENVIPDDLERFEVLDVEHHFELDPKNSKGEYVFRRDPETGKSSITIVGSIDMIVRDRLTNEIFGFEHKTCKNFRDESYLWLDEQPRLYTWALQDYVEKYNQKHPEQEPATLGGVYLNEVKKLLRQFQYKRTLCTYSKSDLDHFMEEFFTTCNHMQYDTEADRYAAPKPSYFSCGMCAFNTICTTYMYGDINKEEILDEFSEEFVEREEDHLEEKTERSKEDQK